MHDSWQQHDPDTIGDLGRVLEVGEACVWNFVAWPVGKLMWGAVKAVNDVMSLILTCSGPLGFQEGNGCRDHGRMTCVCAFRDDPRTRRTSQITQLQSVLGGREQHLRQFRKAPGPGVPCWHFPDARHPCRCYLTLQRHRKLRNRVEQIALRDSDNRRCGTARIPTLPRSELDGVCGETWTGEKSNA